MKFFNKAPDLYNTGITLLAQRKYLGLENTKAFSFILESQLVQVLSKKSDEKIFSTISKHFSDITVINGLSFRDSAINTIAYQVTKDLFETKGIAWDRNDLSVSASSNFRVIEREELLKNNDKISLEDMKRMADKNFEELGDCAACKV